MRERYRGGQSSTSARASRISTTPPHSCAKNVPEAEDVATAPWAMATTELEERMAAFYDGKYDILLSTAIIEVGPRHPAPPIRSSCTRADRFGLAQLYQLRGRVGRSKVRAYALFTVPAKRTMTPQAGEAPESAADPRHARRRLPAREPRSRYPRRRQPPRR